MTTPQQPDDDLKAEPEVIEDRDDADDISPDIFLGGKGIGIPTPARLDSMEDDTSDDAGEITPDVFAGGHNFGIPTPTVLNKIRAVDTATGAPPTTNDNG